ncbi:hypothetical protein [Spirochaeta thermophila]|uniref:Uncharacterized protein n=1 Tax=Winmispira thermophila (strain ATCC 49972 / DSM 6192 / RI 19.B1) TaxID=665571 RepID=E0RTN0_WINT6|nr:hypothetical protein [Spirochaeta thermophila]ADN02261.1 hypothetical protein STHERM_c13200 [Spirochaeta thermophila DSM 6192]
MARITTYAEHLFALETLMQALRDILRLPLEPEVFLDHLIEEVFFFDRSLNLLQRQIERHAELADYKSLLHSAGRARIHFSRLIEDILRKGSALNLTGTSAEKRLRVLQEAQEREVERLKGLISSQEGERDVVSPEEISKLLSPGEED